MREDRPYAAPDWRIGLLAQAGALRPELHRYCARLMGSVIDGEDVVQDALARAFVVVQDLDEPPPLRPWLFRIAHNRALDLLRSRSVRRAEPLEAASNVADPAIPDPVEMLMRQEAVKTAVSRFAELSTLQRSVIILKDVLDESLADKPARRRTRGRRPPRSRAMSRSSIRGTGTACERSWPTT